MGYSETPRGKGYSSLRSIERPLYQFTLKCVYIFAQFSGSYKRVPLGYG
jgi:hypothetical protein